MDIIVLGGNNHRAEMQALMAAIAASGINCICDDNEKAKAIEFKADSYDVDSFRYLKPRDFVIDPPNRPEIKRGKGKVKRW